MARQDAVLQAPRAGLSLQGFPERIVGAGTEWFRAHRAGLGVWWFSSSGDGRFDLFRPRGTCYLASTPESAVRETVMTFVGEGGAVPASLVGDRVVSRLQLPLRVQAARTTADAVAGYGLVGKELASAVTYDISRKWAEKFWQAGFTGVWYSPRFSGIDARALAVFGLGGEARYEPDPSPAAMGAVIDRMPDLHLMTVPTALIEMDVLDDPI